MDSLELSQVTELDPVAVKCEITEIFCFVDQKHGKPKIICDESTVIY